MTAQLSPSAAERAVIWHDAECGAYRADLSFWRALAERAGGPVLDIGCGTGRVALDLAAAGHPVTALDIAEPLVAELAARADAAGLDVDPRVGDARSLSLGRAFHLVIAPMQLIQLIHVRAERISALRSMREHLAPGGTAAVALVEDVPLTGAEGLPLPDVREHDGWVFSSQPLAVEREGDLIVVRRLRQTVSPAGELAEEEDEVRLAVMSAAELEDEARDCGLRPVARRVLPATADHVGSTVIELEAP